MHALFSQLQWRGLMVEMNGTRVIRQQVQGLQVFRSEGAQTGAVRAREPSEESMDCAPLGPLHVAMSPTLHVFCVLLFGGERF